MKQFEREKVIKDVAEKAKKLKETKTDTSGGDISLSDDVFSSKSGYFVRV